MNELSDGTFGAIAPEHYSDIAYTIARNWQSITARLFHQSNKVCQYSFPIPVDTHFSKSLTDEVVVVRFKDDYRILAKTEAEGRHAIKTLQLSLREFKLELNEEKTEIHQLPDGNAPFNTSLRHDQPDNISL